jgi:hypothetical protein
MAQSREQIAQLNVISEVKRPINITKEKQTMNTKRLSHLYLGTVFATIIFLVSACQPIAIAATSDPTQPPAQLSATPVILVTPTALPTQTPPATTGEIVLNPWGVAQGMTVEIMPAVSKSESGPIKPAGPEYHLVNLQGYPVIDHMKKAQIFVFPVGDLASTNEYMAKIAADLQILLQNQQLGDKMPFLPLFNEAQVMHTQVQYLDFKNGNGVRFLTQFSQGIYPLNNRMLFYTFQGLTSDGKYYIAAVLPVTNPELPATDTVNLTGTEYRDELAKTVTLLDQQPANSFTPDLSTLDALIQSIEIK